MVKLYYQNENSLVQTLPTADAVARQSRPSRYWWLNLRPPVQKAISQHSYVKRTADRARILPLTVEVYANEPQSPDALKVNVTWPIAQIQPDLGESMKIVPLASVQLSLLLPAKAVRGPKRTVRRRGTTTGAFQSPHNPMIGGAARKGEKGRRYGIAPSLTPYRTLPGCETGEKRKEWIANVRKTLSFARTPASK
ncbi:hypothetical protein Trydic_g14303 [Trypoxylus dichotomus]